MVVLFFVYAAPIAYNNGVAILSALLKEAGFTTELFVGDGNLDEWHIRVAELPADSYIMFSHVIRKDFDLSVPYIDVALAHTDHVIMGGTFHRRNNSNKYDGRVCICRGDGEGIVNYLLQGNTEVFDHACYDVDLNTLPLPDYDLFKDYPYDGDIKDFYNVSKLPYTTSRGCIGKCGFCEVQHQSGKQRIRTRVADDVVALRSLYDFELLFITDELCPYYDDEWCASWGDTIIPFFAFIRADIPADRLNWLISRGLKGCAFGVESGDEDFRNNVLKKGVTDEDIYRTVKILKDNDVYFAHFYMLNYPAETFKQKLATQKMTASLGGVPMIFDYTPVVYETRKEN